MGCFIPRHELPELAISRIVFSNPQQLGFAHRLPQARLLGN
jgi:hypothetical protein